MGQNRPPPSCPRCRTRNAVPILYGLPVPEMEEESRKGEVMLGGCMIYSDDPDWHCRHCGNEWADPTSPWRVVDHEDGIEDC